MSDSQETKQEGLVTFKHNFRKKGGFAGSRIENGYIYPKDKKEEMALMVFAKRGTLQIIGENELSKRVSRYKRSIKDGVIVQAPPIFDLFTTAEKQLLKKLTPSSKKKIYDYAAEMIKLELGTDLLANEKKQATKVRKIMLIEIPKNAGVGKLREICKSQNPPIEIDIQSDRATLIKLINKRNEELALEFGEKQKQKEIPGSEKVKTVKIIKKKKYTKEEINKMEGEMLDKVFNEHGLDISDLKDDAEKKEVLIAYFENIAKEQ